MIKAIGVPKNAGAKTALRLAQLRPVHIVEQTQA
jgi:hypothetical protein